VFKLELDCGVLIFSSRCPHGKQVPTRPYSEPDDPSPHPHDNPTEHSAPEQAKSLSRLRNTSLCT